MPKVLVVMGSDSDYPVMEPCFAQLKQLGVLFDAVVCSAHRTPQKAAELAGNAIANGYGVVIAAAGLAAHLPGVLAAYTTLPVIGVPVAGGALNGVDALYAIVQMPAGIPVATVAINGGANAAILAAQILAVSDSELRQRLIEAKQKLAESVEQRNQRLQQKLNADY
ncbi:MAG: 5-(carboxyamino)imidazole ribonucleotide mutase [Ruminococcaceae bacterium]|nr:5-(carboxyamino)imidazole ribonucleotide mutase [Oscillospiraceae bacterium]